MGFYGGQLPGAISTPTDWRTAARDPRERLGERSDGPTHHRLKFILIDRTRPIERG